jgi:hypothetical protein
MLSICNTCEQTGCFDEQLASWHLKARLMVRLVDVSHLHVNSGWLQRGEMRQWKT